MVGLSFHPAFRFLSGFQVILFYSSAQRYSYPSSGIFVGIKSQIIFIWNEAMADPRDPVGHPVQNCSSQALKSLNLCQAFKVMQVRTTVQLFLCLLRYSAGFTLICKF